jgi:hypothetical protein
MTEAAAGQLMSRLDERVSAFAGQIDELEGAVGMQILGRLFGWKVLVLVHNKRTIRKYEEILGINVREEFPDVGPLAPKSVGLEFVEKAGKFWKAVSGDYSVPDKRDIEA